MFKLLGFFVKVTVFAVIVLVIGNMVHWNGRTVSDEVRVQLSHAERSAWTGVSGNKHWAGKLTTDTKEGAIRKKSAKPSAQAEPADEETGDIKKIPASERQKLRALIEEMNHTQVKD